MNTVENLSIYLTEIDNTFNRWRDGISKDFDRLFGQLLRHHAEKESRTMTVLDVVAEFLDEVNSVKVQTKLNGRRVYVPLSQVEDQRKVLQVLTDKLKVYSDTLPPRPKREKKEATQ